MKVLSEQGQYRILVGRLNAHSFMNGTYKSHVHSKIEEKEYAI